MCIDIQETVGTLNYVCKLLGVDQWMYKSSWYDLSIHVITATPYDNHNDILHFKLNVHSTKSYMHVQYMKTSLSAIENYHRQSEVIEKQFTR